MDTLSGERNLQPLGSCCGQGNVIGDIVVVIGDGWVLGFGRKRMEEVAYGGLGFL